MTDRARLITNLAKFSAANILCIGDVMLDRFVYGTASRISPEAPIPVLSGTHQNTMLGGAGNVARNIAALGGKVTLVSVTGDDAEAAELRQTIAGQAEIKARLIASSDRPTTVKTRYIADGQQLLRADREVSHALDKKTGAEVLGQFEDALKDAQIVILSDYAKGVLDDEMLEQCLKAAMAADVPVIADPKSDDFSRYAGVTLLTPNRKEMIAASGMPCDTDAEVIAAGQKIMKTAGLKSLLITRSEQGMSLFQTDQEPVHLPVIAQEVFDVSGAGDTVIAVLALALASNASMTEAAYTANMAGGLVVAKSGTATLSLDELRAGFRDEKIHAVEMKVGSASVALEKIADWRARGLKIGFTNGCFDLIHPGHISLMAQAKAQCDRLIVGLNTDASVKRLKGPDRPVTDETSRAIVLASLSSVDLVVPFVEDTPIDLIEKFKPDVLVKGADYTVETVVGADIVQAAGGRVHLADLEAGYSTTRTIERLMENHKES